MQRIERITGATIFGELSGDPTADRVLAALDEHHEITETDVYNLFGRHTLSDEIQRALNALLAGGKAKAGVIATGERPKTIWRGYAKGEESAKR
jgi:hypothetical protein